MCKTLYTLLQDSAEEQELLQAMGRVANTLLKTGEDNVTDVESTGQEVFSPPAENTQTTNSCGEVSTGITSDQQPPTPAEQRSSVGSVTSDQQPPTPAEQSSSFGSVTSDQQPPIPAEQRSSVGSVTSDQQPPIPAEQSSSVGSVTTDCSEAHGDTTSSQLTQKPDDGTTTAFDIAVADAAELEAKWFLTFEQFVAGVQQEPELCQFFAEQNVIDLSGSSVDPILSQYTRTILRQT